MTSSDAVRPATLADIFLPQFMKLASVQPGERVLDVASAGETAIEAARRTGKTGEVLVVDPSREAIETLAARALATGVPAPRTAQMDPAHLELEDSYWDVVTCHLALTDLTDPEALLAEAKRVLRPVGRIAVSVLGGRDRCPLVTVFLDAVSAHLPVINAEAQRIFRYSEPGRLAQLLAQIGYEDAVPERITEWVPFADVDDYWQTITTTTSFGRLARSLSPDAVAASKSAIQHRSRFYRRGNGLEFKVEAVALAAVK